MANITITRTQEKIRTIQILRRRIPDLSLRLAKTYVDGESSINITEENLESIKLYLDILGTNASAIIKPEPSAWMFQSIITEAEAEILIQAKRIEQAKSEARREWATRPAKEVLK